MHEAGGFEMAAFHDLLRIFCFIVDVSARILGTVKRPF